MDTKLLWPRLLRPGGTIGICSPSGPTANAEQTLTQATQHLSECGYQVVLSSQVGEEGSALGKPYLAGSDDARATDLNRFLADPGIDLILCARGGYGAMRILDRVDYEAVRRDPKPLVGYSDVTALSLALLAQAGVVSFSGIMATAGSGFGENTLDPYSAASFFDAVTAGPIPRVLPSPPTGPPWQVHRGPQNTLEGPLIPVCLSLLLSLVGTPFLPDLTGAILLIEDVHEELYAVDRYLTQLRLAGLLEPLAAVLIGSFNGTPDQEEALRTEVPRLCLEMTPPSVAVVSGIAYGHIPCRLTLPVGAPATVDIQARTFRVG
ncbi:MAG: LD-carboxypeptidase [Cytophagales bacterium]|nr:LD-carboxypeptidase [Armatimonadota bacterium]